MEENKTNPGQGTDWKEKLEEKAGELKGKADELLGKVEVQAEAAWKDVSEKAGEWKEVAEEKLEELKEGAEKIWNKIVDKFDGDDKPASPTGQK